MQRIVTSVFVGLLIASCDGVLEPYSDKVARGRAVFESECTSCHGATGAGTPFGGDLRAKLQAGYSYAKFSSVVMSGRSRTTETGERKVMPRFADRPEVTKNLEELYFYLNEEAWPPNRD